MTNISEKIGEELLTGNMPLFEDRILNSFC